MSLQVAIPASQSESLSGTLFVVGMPIGNLEDITVRALRILRDVDIVLCEDTRVTRRVLERYDISVESSDSTYRLRRMDQHVMDSAIEDVVQDLTAGLSICMVTDAGTPCVSDPGWRVVSAVRAAGLSVEVVPGPSALTAALSVSGYDCSRFVFMGFPPTKKGRESFFDELVSVELPVVLYESPYRVRKSLGQLQERCFAGVVVVLRELSKLYEEVLDGTPAELLEQLPDTPKGEFVLIVLPANKKKSTSA